MAPDTLISTFCRKTNTATKKKSYEENLQHSPHFKRGDFQIFKIDIVSALCFLSDKFEPEHVPTISEARGNNFGEKRVDKVQRQSTSLMSGRSVSLIRWGHNRFCMDLEEHQSQGQANPLPGSCMASGKTFVSASLNGVSLGVCLMV